MSALGWSLLGWSLRRDPPGTPAVTAALGYGLFEAVGSLTLALCGAGGR